jgi:NAD(P)H-dependent FMN reductase
MTNERAKPKVGIVIASVREGRGGAPIAAWVKALTEQHGGFDVEMLDLRTIALPMFDEPNHPRLAQYTREESKRWSATVAGLDAFVFVMPEYNHGTPPALVNALDYLLFEWQYKPVGFVSYGGLSGGLRSVAMTKPILAALKMVPIVEAVVLPMYAQHVDKGTGAFVPGEAADKSCAVMLDELKRWESALRTLRAPRA